MKKLFFWRGESPKKEGFDSLQIYKGLSKTRGCVYSQKEIQLSCLKTIEREEADPAMLSQTFQNILDHSYYTCFFLYIYILKMY